MKPSALAEQKQHQVIFVKNRLIADNSRNLPTRLQIIKTGMWENSWKGDIEITLDDLLETKVNFMRGIGLPDGGSEGAPVDYSHEDWSKAAFWIKAVEVDEANGILWASDIEWTPAGKEAVLSGEFKFFSPSIYPRSMGKWQNPEDPTDVAQNVLLGGGLTNIPFFKGLTGLNASQTPQGDGRENVIYFAKEGDVMDLAELRTKKKEELTPEQAEFLTEHKAELTAEEQLATGVVEPTPAPAATTEDAPAAAPAPVEDAEAVALQADIRSGKKLVVDAAEYQGLKASAERSEAKLEAMEKEKIEGRVDAHIARGAIKQDQRDKWVGLIQADASNEDLLKGLNDNPLLASELGSASAEGSAKARLDAAVKKLQDEKTELSYGDAVSQVRKADPDLAKAYDQELKGL